MGSEILEQIQKEQQLGEIEELILDDIVIDTFNSEDKKAIENLEELITLSMNEC